MSDGSDAMTHLLVSRSQPGANSIAVSLEQAIAQGRVVVTLDRRKGERRRGKAQDMGQRAGQRRRVKPIAYVGIVLETP